MWLQVQLSTLRTTTISDAGEEKTKLLSLVFRYSLMMHSSDLCQFVKLGSTTWTHCYLCSCGHQCWLTGYISWPEFTTWYSPFCQPFPGDKLENYWDWKFILDLGSSSCWNNLTQGPLGSCYGAFDMCRCSNIQFVWALVWLGPRSDRARFSNLGWVFVIVCNNSETFSPLLLRCWAPHNFLLQALCLFGGSLWMPRVE